MEFMAGLEFIKPACAGIELWYRALLIFLEVIVAIHGLLFGVVEGHV